MDTVVITNASVVVSVTNSSTIIRDDFLDIMEIDVKEPCFSCNLTDSKDAQTTVQNPLSINGGFIAMAAGLSVVIPLICVLIIQLRRAKREERERARQAATASGGESGGVDGPAADLPPSYEQLFGPDHVSPAHSRNGSLDALIEENETGHSGSDSESGRSRNANAAQRNTTRASIDSVDSGGSIGSRTQQVPLVGAAPRPTTALSTSTVSSVATISGSQVTDVPVNSTSLSQPAGAPSARTAAASSSSLGNNANASSNLNANASSSTSTSTQGSRSAPSTSSSTVDYPPPPYTSPRPTSSFSAPSTSLPSSSSSQSGSAPPPPPPPPPPPAPRSPPPPFSSWSHRRNNPTNRNPNAVNNRQNSNSELSRLGQTLRRLPGMHISIEDFFASLRGLYDNNESDGPPPSYEEALKILESAKIAKENENRIH